ncbi:site-specific integrase [Alistipes indistinctus]|jgi:integrase/recombinase XerD|uniref:site-specific integrase n=1 Tax=Alistipes indistinctus TaxID=626932 RepID=UPI0026DC176F|nr:site-specific integrase [Alistipes indistinctus]
MQYSKDGITVAVVLDKYKPKRNGLYPVRIRVTYRRQRQYYPTGKDLTLEQWERIPLTRNRDLKTIRESIANSFDIVRQNVDELATLAGFSFEALNTRLKSGATDTINTAFRAKIADLNEQNRVGNAIVYNNVLKGLERFAGDKIRFDVVTVEWVKKYEKFLHSEDKTTSTIGIHLRTLRTILNEARRSGIIKESQYPFGRGRYEIQAGEGRKLALTLDQIGKIARYEDGSDATAKYRDYWMFLYLCNGINMADFVKLKYGDIVNGELCFVRQKTERTTRTRKEIHVIVSEPMQKIIDRRGNVPEPDNYIFPVLTGNETALEQKRKTQYLTRAINKRMTMIGKALGIDHISTYTARHSFATVLKRSGANIAYISESLGHQDLKTTENYLASFEREEREKNAELLTKF